MKTKYIKVSVADRLPEKSGTYYSEIGEVFFAQSRGKFEHNYEAHNVSPEFWLEPVPDREEEMREMLEECLNSLNWVSQNCKMPTIEEEHDAEEQVHHVGYRIQELTKLLNELKPN